MKQDDICERRTVMTQKYQDWLATQIINEGNIVNPKPPPRLVFLADARQISYRSLSRALKVHSNAAKE